MKWIYRLSLFIVVLSAKDLRGFVELKDSELTQLRDYVQNLLSTGDRGISDKISTLKSFFVSSANDKSQRIDAAVQLGTYYYQQEDMNMAWQYLRAANILAGPDSPAELDLVTASLLMKKQGNEQKSIELAKKAFQKSDRLDLRQRAFNLLSRNYFALGSPDKIPLYYKQFRLDVPQRTRLFNLDQIVAKAFAASEKDAEEIEILERLLETYPITPESVWAFERLMEYSKKSTYKFSRSALRRLCINKEISPNIDSFLTQEIQVVKFESDPSLNLIALANQMMGCQLVDQVTPLRDQLLGLAYRGPNSKIKLEAVLAVIKYYRMTKSPDKAVELIADWSEKNSQHPSRNRVLLHMVYIHNEFEPKKSVDILKGIVERRPYQAHLKWSLFSSLYRTESWKEAHDLLSNGITPKDPGDHGSVQYWKARLNERLKKSDDAFVEYQQVAALKQKSWYTFMAESRLQSRGSKSKAAASGDEANSAIVEIGDKRLPISSSEYPLHFLPAVTKSAEMFEIDPLLVLALMRQESQFDTYATSWVGALGLMQIMPKTAYRLAVLFSLGAVDISKLYDPEFNIALGTVYLKMLLQIFEGRVPIALAAYNAGPINVNNWLSGCRGCEIDEFVEAIPFRETRRYVKKVVSNYAAYQKIYRNEDYTLTNMSTVNPLTDDSRLF